jgi:hypothetical protein
MIHHIPEDINIEVLLNYLPADSCKIAIKGLHKRNTYNDIISMEEMQGSNKVLFNIGRNSLYNALPEYMFHPIDRFQNLPKQEEKERFAEEYEEQEREKENAYKFFAPLDILLLQLRMKVREHIECLASTNIAIQHIIGDRLTEQQRQNRFIKQLLPYLPDCKNIRGDKTLLSLLLRKLFMEEGLSINLHREQEEFCDAAPRYEDGIGGTLGECYAGNTYDERVTIYDIHFWSDEECNENFLRFVDEVKEMEKFLQDFFLSVEDTIRFDIYDHAAPLRLSDEKIYNYLNYNTNL